MRLICEEAPRRELCNQESMAYVHKRIAQPQCRQRFTAAGDLRILSLLLQNHPTGRQMLINPRGWQRPPMSRLGESGTSAANGPASAISAGCGAAATERTRRARAA